MYQITPRRLLLGIIFFVLLYYEDLAIGGLTLGQLWKIPIIVVALLYVLGRFQAVRAPFPGYLAIGLLLAAKIALNGSFPKGILQDLAEMVYTLTLPLSIAHLSLHYRRKRKKLIELMIGLSLFFILSSFPFLLGIVAERKMVTSLEKIGLEGQTALNGLFFHVSSTSKILVVSLIIWIASRRYLKDTLFYRVLYPTVCALGLYSIYRCYTRTGWLMLIVGLLVMFFYRVSSRRFFFVLPPLAIALVMIFFHVVQKNTALDMRLRGETTYRTNEAFDMNLVSSFRLDLYKETIRNFIGESPFTQFMGYGKVKSIESMEDSLGVSLVSHNRPMEILQYGGIVALILYFLFLWKLFLLIKFNHAKRSFAYDDLPFIILVIYIISIIPSHGFPIWADLLFGGVIALSMIDKEYKHNQTLLNKYAR